LFFQSLTEATKDAPGVLVVGSLPGSGAEAGNQRKALARYSGGFWRRSTSVGGRVRSDTLVRRQTGFWTEKVSPAFDIKGFRHSLLS
jgi:hypothetical protein